MKLINNTNAQIPTLSYMLSVIICACIVFILLMTFVVKPYTVSQINDIREQAQTDFYNNIVNLDRYYRCDEPGTTFPEFYYKREIDVLLEIEKTKNESVKLSDYCM